MPSIGGEIKVSVTNIPALKVYRIFFNRIKDISLTLFRPNNMFERF